MKSVIILFEHFMECLFFKEAFTKNYYSVIIILCHIQYYKQKVCNEVKSFISTIMLKWCYDCHCDYEL